MGNVKVPFITPDTTAKPTPHAGNELEPMCLLSILNRVTGLLAGSCRALAQALQNGKVFFRRRSYEYPLATDTVFVSAGLLKRHKSPSQ